MGISDQPLSMVNKCTLAPLYMPRLSQGFSASHCWRSEGGVGRGDSLCTIGCGASLPLPPLDASSGRPHDDNQECLQAAKCPL